MSAALQIPSREIIEAVREVYERGLTVDALRRAEQFAPLQNWDGVNECIMAARIAVNAGAPRLATRLSLRAWRRDRNHPAAQLQYGFELSERRGPLAVWQAMRTWKLSSQATVVERAELLALQARVAGDLRDFGTAEELLKQADELAGNKPWIRLQRSHLLERQDQLEEALEVAKSASALHPFPFYRPGVQTIAHLLQLLDRDEDAIAILTEAGGVLQSGPVMAQLYGILSENGRWAEAEAALARYVELSPLLEPPLKNWVSSQRARTAYHSGRRSEAAQTARTLTDEFHRKCAEKLEGTPVPNERVHLDVSFVRQHFKTCAPATLAALGRFWGMQSEHVKLAEAMCYDGTPAWQQREWAEQNGWFVREFRVTHESGLQLIDRGIPFAISTVEATSAHMQAVVGFDRVRETILLRDPGQPYTVELFAEFFFKRYRAFGPHGTVFIPIAERHRLEGLELPDAELYDEYHRFWLSLKSHDREAAERVWKRMFETHPEHELTWEARLDLASYDTNVTEQLRCLDKLLELHPRNPARLLRKLGCLSNCSRAERIEFLERACKAEQADPVLFIELARILNEDARDVPVASRWLKRALRYRPYDSNAISVQADLLWAAGRFDEATELYRFAANLEGYREHLYQTWFWACRRTRRTKEAMAILEDRFRRFGTRSEQPGMTLAWALRELEQPERARQIYAEAARLRPENGYLLLNAAILETRLANFDQTEKLLTAARDKVRKSDWLRARAEITEMRWDAAATLKVCREILEIEPLALDAHGRAARALGQLEGNARAIEHLKSACASFPHHYGLRRMHLDWSREGSLEDAETTARELLRIDPADAWGRRELAAILMRGKRNEEALQEATEAAAIEPRNSFSYSMLGHVYRQLKKIPEARAAFRRAVELNVDNTDALHALLDLASTDSQRKDDLAFIESQLIQQVVMGDGLLAFQELARPVIAPETLLQSLQFAHKERPDLWHAWSALGLQLGHLNRLDDALEIAREASRRFPHMPRIWLDLAQVHQWRGEIADEIAAAQRAFEINPAWNRVTLALTGALERVGKLDDAREIYERALQHSAQDPQIHACYAHLAWRQQRHDEAFAEIERALRIAPGYEWAWDLLRTWANERGEPQRAGNFARALAAERPGEMRTWLMLARVLAGPETMAERLNAVTRALELSPQSVDAWDLKAELLALEERFDEAIETANEGARNCMLEAYVLRGRHAWVEARRRRLAEAIRLMREVLRENANYVWGWNQLAHWLIAQNELGEAATALETLQKLLPHDPWVNRQLGLLKLKQDDRTAAKKAFAAALQISPTDIHAALNLFDLQLESGDLDGTASTLRLMQLHQPGAPTQASEILLLTRKKDFKAASLVLEKLCESTDPEAWPLNSAAHAFHRAGNSAAAMKIFKRALRSKTCNPQVGASAVELLVAGNNRFAAVQFFLRLKNAESQRRAAAPLVGALAEHQERWLFRWLLWRRRQVLAQDDAAWGQVGFALSSFNCHKQAAHWLSDWRSRRDVQPWMLFNLALGLRQMGRYDESTEVVRYALNKWEHRDGAADLRLFLAVEDALSGDIAGARKHLQQVSYRPNVSYDADLLALAKALIKFQEPPTDDRAQAAVSACADLAKQFSTWRMLNLMSDVRRTFRRTGKMFAKQGGGWRARMWFGWRLHWQWLLLPIGPLFILLAVQPPVLLGVLVWWFVAKNKKR